MKHHIIIGRLQRQKSVPLRSVDDDKVDSLSVSVTVSTDCTNFDMSAARLLHQYCSLSLSLSLCVSVSPLSLFVSPPPSLCVSVCLCLSVCLSLPLYQVHAFICLFLTRAVEIITK